MTLIIFGCLAAACSLWSFVPGVRDIRARTFQPSPLSWLIWSAAQVLLFASQFASGGKASLALSASEAAGCALIAALAWRSAWRDQRRQARLPAGITVAMAGGYTPPGKDRWWWLHPGRGADDAMPPKVSALILALTAAALAGWWFAGPGLAVTLIVAVDSIGVGITIRKVRQHPASESLVMWWWYGAGGAFAFAAVGHGARILYLYPAVAVAQAAAVVAVAWAGGETIRLPGRGPASWLPKPRQAWAAAGAVAAALMLVFVAAIAFGTLGQALQGISHTRAPAPVAIPAAAQAAPVMPGGLLTTWARTAGFESKHGGEPLMCFTRLESYFDVVQPAATAPGHWDAAYHVQLATDGGQPLPAVAVWASTHNRAPARRVVATPVFDGVTWKLWVTASGAYTFTLAYNGTELGSVRGYAVAFPARRWTYGTVDLLDMLRWMRAHRYLPAGVRVAGLQFGFEFERPVPGGEFTVRKYTLDWHAR